MKATFTASEETMVVLHIACNQGLPAMSLCAVGIYPLRGFSEHLEKSTEEKSSKDC